MIKTDYATKKSSFFWLLLIFAPLPLYLASSFLHTADIFYGDDFDLLETIAFAPDADSWREKWRLWTKQQNEHRILFPRFITFLCYQIEGYINWKTLALVASLIWIGVLFFLWKTFASLRLPLWLFAPIPFLLLQPQYYENVIWSISILQQSNVLFWICFAVFLYAKGHHKAMFLPAFVAIFTHGNGLSIIPVITLLLILERNWSQLKRWIPFSCFVIALYFFGLHSGQGAGIKDSLSNPIQLILAFFAFLGGFTRVFLQNPIWAAAAGCAMFVTLAVALFPSVLQGLRSPGRKMPFFDTFLLGTTVVLLISAVLVSVSRSWGGLENILPPRYLHNTAFFFCLTYLGLLKMLSRSKTVGYLGGLALAGAMVFNAVSYFVNITHLRNHSATRLAEETNYLNLGVFPQYHWTFDRNIKERYQTALAKGVVKMTRRLPDIDRQYDIDPETQLRFSVSFQAKKGETTNRKTGFLQAEGDNTTPTQNYLYLQPESGNGYWIALEKTRPPFRGFLTGRELRGRYVNGSIPYENLPVGEYQAGVLTGDTFSWTGQKLAVSNDSLSVY